MMTFRISMLVFIMAYACITLLTPNLCRIAIMPISCCSNNIYLLNVRIRYKVQKVKKYYLHVSGSKNYYGGCILLVFSFTKFLFSPNEVCVQCEFKHSLVLSTLLYMYDLFVMNFLI